ncbi:MAG TPA: hypothetical protein DER02_12065 [Gammaproteobacteria bacterium]|nr:hypothetical protein [Gammaproteobacteria bacterium]|tara:strand:+ start:356 stop:1657 length:1302 start_codon:yes stop_codon:yes gene_type:complete
MRGRKVKPGALSTSASAVLVDIDSRGLLSDNNTRQAIVVKDIMMQNLTELIGTRAHWRDAPAPMTVLSLWPEKAPGALGSGSLHEPQLTVHLPAPSLNTGCAMIVNPGGGYRSLASDHEGLQVALWLNRHGIAAFVLRYRLGPQYPTSISTSDGQRAVRLVRANAAAFAVDPERLGMLGFSAGGHLTMAVAVVDDLADWPDAIATEADAVDAVSAVPNFLVPIYAVTNGAHRGRKPLEYFPVDTRVTPQTPPTFIVHTHQDEIVPARQATLLYDALLKVGVATELHIFNQGEHGLGLMPGDPDVAQWCALLLQWLCRHGFLTAAKRTEVSGSVTIDGEPFAMGWVTLLPHEPTHPLARVRITAAQQGSFTLFETNGPVAGEHTVEVYVVSRKYPPDGVGDYSMAEPQRYRCVRRITPGARLDLSLDWNDFSPA